MEYYTDQFEDGTYHCAGCGTALFLSSSKFKSKSEYPTFRKALPGSVKKGGEHSDDDGAGVVCAECGQHLGHVSDDGEDMGDKHPDAGQRYSILSEALEFEEGEGDDE